jgi:molybdate-binding protein/DNA-binding XRE family transcriptional regulator
MRQNQGIQQRELAARAGISRQALSDLEAGTACPSTAVALALARALRCKVEDLFALSEDSEPIRANWVCLDQPERGSAPMSQAASRRAVLAFISDRWVAHPLTPNQPASMCTPADALVVATARRGSANRLGSSEVRVQPLRSRSELRDNVLIAGCDPAIGLLCAWLGERHARFRLRWLYATSVSALGALARGEVQIAGAHLLDEASGEFNVPFVRPPSSAQSLLIVNLARWEEGFVVAPGNPLGIRGAHDLVRSDVTFVNREEGSEARKLIDRLLRKEALEAEAVRGFQRIAHGHTAVAQTVAAGAADAGIATRSAASGLDLSFVPLSEERFDLALSREQIGDDWANRLIDALESRAFRRELQSLEGYATVQSGQVVAEVRAE